MHVPYLSRYDLLLLVCLITQALMLLTRLETMDELKVITLFHLIGLGLELFKVHMGSWSYPGQAWSKIGGVPLYSGFMYASVASYICQAWRRLDLRFYRSPNQTASLLVAVLIYANFFTHHWLSDLRWGLIGLTALLFWRTTVAYTVGKRTLRMPILLSFALIALFIWLAENISTLLGAWRYPDQERGWTLVHWGKLSSWYLLVMISLLIVARLKQLKRNAELSSRSSQSASHVHTHPPADDLRCRCRSRQR